MRFALRSVPLLAFLTGAVAFANQAEAQRRRSLTGMGKSVDRRSTPLHVPARRSPLPWILTVLLGITGIPSVSAAQESPAYTQEECPYCADWNRPREPVRVFSDTYWVGTEGLGSILITSEGGHILIDGGLPASVPLIRDNIQALGFRLEDVRLIVTSHAHFDHVGGVAALQRASGAEVAATKPSAATLKRGAAGPDDPQFGEALDFPPVRVARVIEDGDTLRAGDLALVAHITAGHTPGGTSWSWMSCEEDRCLEVVYADSQTPISADGFLFSQSSTYPTAVEDFRRGQERLASLRCDILLTPHPGASAFWKRVAARTAGDSDALVDGGGCHRYAETAKRQLERRLEQEGPDDVPKGPPQVVGSPGPNSRRR